MGILDGLKSFSKGLLATPEEGGQSKLGLLGDQFLDWDDGGNRGAVSQQQQLMRRDAMAQQRARQQQQRGMLEEGASLGLSPMEQFLLKTNPEAFAAVLKEKLAPYTLSQGSIRGEGGQTIQAAPVISEMGDRFGFADPVGKTATYSAPRDPSFAENTTRQRAEEDVRLEQQRLAELIRNNQANNRVAQGNLGVRQQEYRARQAQGGFGTPGYGGAPARVYGDDEVEITP